MWESLAVRCSTFTEPVRRRIDEKCASRGLIFPWWVPIVSTVGGVAVVAISLAMRDALWPPTPLAFTLILVTVPALVMFGTDIWLPPPVEAIATLIAAVVLLAAPVSAGTTDVAPAILVLATAEAVSTSGLLVGWTTGLVSMGILALAGSAWDLENLPIHVLIVLLGCFAGTMLRTQMRTLLAEQAARAGDQERAALAERQTVETQDLPRDVRRNGTPANHDAGRAVPVVAR